MASLVRIAAIKVSALAGAALVLAGCTTLQPRPPGSEVQQAWSGRYALTVSSPGSETQRSSGSFSLIDSSKSIQLELSTPLGVTLASARVDADGASLVTADGKRYSARSGEDLTEQLFGWRIPVQRLPAWFNGKPARITESLSRQDLPDQPIAGEEDGWFIRYEAWAKEKPYKVLLSVPDRVILRMILDD